MQKPPKGGFCVSGPGNEDSCFDDAADPGLRRWLQPLLRLRPQDSAQVAGHPCPRRAHPRHDPARCRRRAGHLRPRSAGHQILHGRDLEELRTPPGLSAQPGGVSPGLAWPPGSRREPDRRLLCRGAGASASPYQGATRAGLRTGGHLEAGRKAVGRGAGPACLQRCPPGRGGPRGAGDQRHRRGAMPGADPDTHRREDRPDYSDPGQATARQWRSLTTRGLGARACSR